MFCMIEPSHLPPVVVGAVRKQPPSAKSSGSPPNGNRAPAGYVRRATYVHDPIVDVVIRILRRTIRIEINRGLHSARDTLIEINRGATNSKSIGRGGRRSLGSGKSGRLSPENDIR